MTTTYDYIVVGGGPTGLTLATHLPGKVALLERQNVLGGCHRFDPSNPRFVEHGPRVYSGAYVNTADILRTIGLSWDQVFVKAAFTPELIDGKRWYQWLSAKEIAWISLDYTIFALFDTNHGKNISMKNYCKKHNFSARSLAYIDLVCRFSDGAGAERYSLWEFVSGFDQHLRPFYLPRKPNDYLYGKWQAYLEGKGVDILLRTNVLKMTKTTVVTSAGILHAKKHVILTIPPLYADKLMRKSGLGDSKFKDFAKKTKYDRYWSVSFFGVTVDNSKGHKTTPWGVLAMQYPFDVVSAAATIWNVKSPVTGKTLNETKDSKEAAAEIRRQLGFSSKVEYAFHSGKYNDQAFMATAKKGYSGPVLKNGVITVGCHNGNSNYHFTSMESAVQNALAYLKMDVRSPWHASDVLRWSVLGLVLAYTLRRI